MFTGKKAWIDTREENKTFLSNIVTGFSCVDKFVVKIWPQFTQTVIHTEKLATTPQPPKFSLSDKSHFLSVGSSLPCHADETERNNVCERHRSGNHPCDLPHSHSEHTAWPSGVQLSSQTH